MPPFHLHTDTPEICITIANQLHMIERYDTSVSKEECKLPIQPNRNSEQEGGIMTREFPANLLQPASV